MNEVLCRLNLLSWRLFGGTVAYSAGLWQHLAEAQWDDLGAVGTVERAVSVL